jgi:hypothetical protein
MADKRLTRSAGVVLALAGTGALLTGGIAVAQGEHQDAKSPPPGSGAMSVSGHTVRVSPSGARSAGSAEAKSPPAGSVAVSVDGHTVRVRPSGAPSSF